MCGYRYTHHMIHIEKSVSRTKSNIRLQDKKHYFDLLCIVLYHRGHCQLMNEILLSLVSDDLPKGKHMKCGCLRSPAPVGRWCIPFFVVFQHILTIQGGAGFLPPNDGVRKPLAIRCMSHPPETRLMMGPFA